MACTLPLSLPFIAADGHKLTHLLAILQTLLSRCTKTASATAAYEYTTLTAIPGVLELQGANVQLLDLPGIIEGASQGRGRGRQVVSVVKTSDLIIMMLDCSKAKDQVRYLHAVLSIVTKSDKLTMYATPLPATALGDGARGYRCPCQPEGTRHPVQEEGELLLHISFLKLLLTALEDRRRCLHFVGFSLSLNSQQLWQDIDPRALCLDTPYL